MSDLAPSNSIEIRDQSHGHAASPTAHSLAELYVVADRVENEETSVRKDVVVF